MRIVFAVLLAALTGITGAVGTGLVLREQRSDANAIDVAGRQRMLSQRMSKEALIIERSGDAREALAGTASLFDRSLTALISGGETMGTDCEPIVPPASLDAAQAPLSEVVEIWQSFEPAVSVIADPSVSVESSRFAQALSVVLSRNTDLLSRSNAAVVALAVVGTLVVLATMSSEHLALRSTR